MMTMQGHVKPSLGGGAPVTSEKTEGSIRRESCGQRLLILSPWKLTGQGVDLDRGDRVCSDDPNSVCKQASAGDALFSKFAAKNRRMIYFLCQISNLQYHNRTLAAGGTSRSIAAIWVRLNSV
jgi:hypothetical protein